MAIEQGSMFVPASNSLGISGEEILTEYKTQNSVEQRFKNLKSHEFVNALYLKTSQRVEALMYLILIGLMI